MPETIRTKLRQNGASLRAIRQREGLSISQLAAKVTAICPISEPHLRNIENELKNASVEHLAAIAKVLDCSLNALRCDPHAEEPAA